MEKIKSLIQTVTVLTVIISLHFKETKKKINCIIYIVIGKYCRVIKWGEFKSDQKYFAR